MENLLYSLKYIRRETERIASDWNGKDKRFISGGDVYFEEDVETAEELLEKLDEVEELVKALHL